MADLYSKIPPGHFSNVISLIENDDGFNQMIARRRARQGHKCQEIKKGVSYLPAPAVKPLTWADVVAIGDGLNELGTAVNRSMTPFGNIFQAFGKSDLGRTLIVLNQALAKTAPPNLVRCRQWAGGG